MAKKVTAQSVRRPAKELPESLETHLNVYDRIVLLSMLPKEGSVEQVIAFEMIRRDLQLTEAEEKRYEFKTDEQTGSTRWNQLGVEETVQFVFEGKELAAVDAAWRLAEHREQIRADKRFIELLLKFYPDRRDEFAVFFMDDDADTEQDDADAAEAEAEPENDSAAEPVRLGGDGEAALEPEGPAETEKEGAE